jgi:AsmA protein
MTRIFKLLGAVLAAVMALAIIGAVVLAWTFDPNDYKGYAETWVKERTGRDFRLEQDLKLAFFPWLAVETGGITLGNAAGFGPEPFARIDEAAVRVRLLPLLSKRIEIGTIALDGVALNLAVDAAGKGNWEDLVNAEQTAPTAAASTEPSALDTLDIAGLTIRNGAVSWRENTTDLRYSLSKLTLDAGHIALGAPIDLEIAFDLLDAAAGLTLGLAVKGEVEAQADGAVSARDVDATFRVADSTDPEHAQGRLQIAALDMTAEQRVETGATTLSATLNHVAVDPSTLAFEAAWTSAAFAGTDGSLRMSGLTTRTADIEAAWELQGQSMLEQPVLSGSVRIAGASLANAVERLALELPRGLDARSLGTLDLTATFTAALDPQRITLTDVNANALGMALAGEATLAGNALSARVQAPAFTPNEAMSALIRANVPSDIDSRAIDRLAFGARVQSNLDTGQTSIRDLRAELLGATLTGEIDTVPQRGGTLYRGTLKSSRFPPGPFVTAFRSLLPDPIAPNELGTLALDTHFAYDTANDSLTLDPLALELFGLVGQGQLTGRTVSASPSWSGQVAVQRFVPRDLFKRFGQPVPETSDPAALTRATINTRFLVDEARGRFENITLDLDDSRITGDFTVEGFENSLYQFALAIDKVDVDRYLPPSSEQAAEGEAAAGDIELPVEALNGLKLDGRVAVGNLTMAGMRFDDVATDLKLGGGSAALNSARAKLYGGEFQGSLAVDARGTEPTLSLAGRATGLQLAPLIEALFAEPANVSGTGNFDLALAGHGLKVIDNVKTAAGDLRFTLSNGTIEGFNLGRTLCSVYNTSQKLAQPAKAANATAYQSIGGTAKVTNGVAQSSDLLARTAFMDVTGKGGLTLAEQRLDYELNAKLTGPIGIQGCESMQPLIGDSIPLRIRGTVTEPEILPDFSEILRQRLRQEAQKSITNRLQERLQDLVKPK